MISAFTIQGYYFHMMMVVTFQLVRKPFSNSLSSLPSGFLREKDRLRNTRIEVSLVIKLSTFMSRASLTPSRLNKSWLVEIKAKKSIMEYGNDKL